jgi:hypothetical protein
MKQMKKVTEERSRIRIQRQKYGSADLDPDPHQHVTDPQHCLQLPLPKKQLYVANMLC